MQTQVKYLGHVVSSAGVATDPEKIKAVSQWPEPADVMQLGAFLGTTGYYHRYVSNYASVSKPLTLLANVGKVYQAVIERNDIEKEALHVDSTEIKRLAKMYPHLQINTNGVLTASIVENERIKVVAVCSPALRQKVV